MYGSTRRILTLSHVLLDLHESGDVATLLQTASEGIERCIGCDAAMVSLSRDPVAGDTQYFGSMANDFERVVRGVDRGIAEQNPIYRSRLRLELQGPTTLDTADRGRAFDRSDFSAHVLAPLRAKRILHWLNVSPFPVSIVLTRAKGDDFDSDDVETVRAIGSHLSRRLKQLQVRRGVHRKPLEAPWLIPRQSWLVTDRTGRIVRAEPEAMALLSECVGGRAVGQRLPAAMCDALQRRLRGGEREALGFQLPHRLVRVYLAPIQPVVQECSCTLIERTLADEPDERFVHLGLTRRQSEILHWMCEGKTNVEIGIILGISALTAKKHVENILHKLGVETRTAAVVRAIEA